MRIVQGTLPLSQLIISPLNARPHERDERQEQEIDGLALSIATIGLIQPIAVHKLTKPKGKYGVIAGGRRLAALCRAQDGFEDKASPDVFPTLAFDAQAIPVRIIEEASDAELVEASITENFQREPMTDVQIYRAVKLARETKGGKAQTDEQLADAFGITLQRMRRILRLAFVHPTLLEAYENGKIRKDSLFAYASTDDQDRQIEAWKSLGGPARGWQADRTAEIRQALGTSADNDIAEALAFVGADAYEAAGGKIERDLFDERQSQVKDVDLLHKLVADKLEATRAAIAAARPDVEITFQAEPPQGKYGTDWDLRARESKPRELLDAVATAADAYDALFVDNEDDDPWYELGDLAECDDLDAQLDELELPEKVDRKAFVAAVTAYAQAEAALEEAEDQVDPAATVCVVAVRHGKVETSWWYPDRKAAKLTEQVERTRSSSSSSKPAAPKVGEPAFDPDTPPLTQRAVDHLKAMRVNQAARYVTGDSERHRSTARRAHRALIFALAHNMMRSYTIGHSIGLVPGAAGQSYAYMGTGLEPVPMPIPEGLKGKGLENPDPVLGWLQFDAFMDDEQVDQLAGWIFARKVDPSLYREVPTVVDDVFAGLAHLPDARACAQPDMDLSFFKLWPKKVLGEFGQKIANNHKVAIVNAKGDGPAKYLADMHGQAEPGSPASGWLIKALRWLGVETVIEQGKAQDARVDNGGAGTDASAESAELEETAT